MPPANIISRLPSASLRPLAGAGAATRGFHSTAQRLIVHHAKTTEEFDAALKKNDKVIVDCFAEWCGPCKAIAPILSRISEEVKTVHFIKIDVDALPELSQRLGVRAMPTFLFYKNGDKCDELVGASPPDLMAKIKALQGN